MKSFVGLLLLFGLIYVNLVESRSLCENGICKDSTNDYRIEIETSSHQTQLNRPFIVICKITPTPYRVSYQWLKDGQFFHNGKEMNFEQFTASDYGDYRCIAKIETMNGNTLTLEAYQTINRKTSMKSNQYEVSIITTPTAFEINRPLQMVCMVKPDSGSNIRYKWYKNGEYVSNSRALYYSKFEINGRVDFKCEVEFSSNSGYLQKLSADKYFQYSTYENEKETNNIEHTVGITQNPTYVKYGERLELRCRMSPEERDVKYVWYKDNQYAGSGDVLIIERFSSHDLVEYKCEVRGTDRNGYRFDYKAYYNYRGTKKTEKFNVNIKSNPTIAHFNQRLELECNLSPEAKFATFTWFKNGNRLSNQRNLVIEKFSRNDMANYKCEVEGESDSGYKFKSYATMNYNQPSEESTFRLSISATPSSFITYGDRLVMKCQLSQALDQVKYAWYKNGQFIHNDQSHVIDSFGANDMANYLCEAEGKSRSGKYLKLKATRYYKQKVSNSYQLEIRPSQSVAYFGKPLVLNCEMTPQASGFTYKWYKNGYYLREGQSLRIDQFSQSDLARYRCVAEGTSSNGSKIQVEATYFYA